eukprot:GFUD01038769.1.p1 GENE.GFUD01038769.1~~GFUD01038769.1.p1  ORF type:complete len:412 (+),score=135.02 GFUD01038769.1:32-1267(+)
MENSETMYKSSTKQLVTFLENFASQLAVTSPASNDSHESDSFDSFLSRPSFVSDINRADGDIFRPSISSYDTIPSRQSVDSFCSVPSRSSVDSFKTIPSRPSVETVHRPGYVDSYSSVQGRGVRNTKTWDSYATMPGKLSTDMTNMSDSYSRLVNSSGRMTDSFSRLPGKSEAHRRLPVRSDSFNSVLTSRSQSDDEEEVYKNTAVGPVRSRMMMGSSHVRRALARDTGSLARRTSSSVDLLEDTTADCHLPGRRDYRSGEKRALNVRSKSFASGLSSCGEDQVQEVEMEGRDATNRAVVKKEGSKVQRFLRQIRNLVGRDEPKNYQKKKRQKVTGVGDDATGEALNISISCNETLNEVSKGPKSRAVMRIGVGDSMSMSRSTSQTLELDRTKVTPKKVLSFNHSTPRLLK